MASMPNPDEDTVDLKDKDFFDKALKGEEPEKPEEEKPETKAGPEEEPDEPDEGESEEPKDKAEADGDKPKRADYRVPSWRLREANEAKEAERIAREAAETRLRDREAEIERERRELAEARRQVTQPRREPEPSKAPDPIENPEGYRAFVRAEVARERRIERINETFEDAREDNPDAFDKAWDAIQQADPSVIEKVKTASNPGRALMRWHKEQIALREIGTDVDGFRKRTREEALEAALKDPDFRKRALDAWNTEARKPGNGHDRPDSEVRLPPSLNRATGSRSNERADTEPMSDQELFRHVAR